MGPASRATPPAAVGRCLVREERSRRRDVRASTKLIHGGLRYLEIIEFRLGARGVAERETLWRIAPHIIWPLRFVLPHHQGLRPAWLLRLGLFLYDHLGARDLLPPTRDSAPAPRSGGRAAEARVQHRLRIFRLLGRGLPAGRAERARRRRSRRVDRAAHSLHHGAAGRRRLAFDAARRADGAAAMRSAPGRSSTPPVPGSATS